MTQFIGIDDYIKQFPRREFYILCKQQSLLWKYRHLADHSFDLFRSTIDSNILGTVDKLSPPRPS